MNEVKGPFEAAMRGLEMDLAILREGPGTKDRDAAVGEYEVALRVLEAAGRVDKAISLEVHNRKPSVTTTKEQYTNACRQIRALLEALPEPEEEPKIYRCESCGKDFDKKTFSHSRTEENMMGEPVEVECGPISEVK